MTYLTFLPANIMQKMNDTNWIQLLRAIKCTLATADSQNHIPVDWIVNNKGNILVEDPWHVCP